MRIVVGEQICHLDVVSFWYNYFQLLRKGLSAVGYDENDEVCFYIQRGREQFESTRRLFSASVETWLQPSPSQVRALFHVFEDRSSFIDCVGIHRNTVQLWGSTGMVNFVMWRYALYSIGIDVEPPLVLPCKSFSFGDQIKERHS